MMVNNLTRIKVRVEPNPLNRHLDVEWFVFEGFESRKYFQLDAEKSPKFYQFTIKLEEPGDWTVRAMVRRSDDSVKADYVTVIVKGSDE